MIFPMTTAIALKNSKKAYPPEINFMIMIKMMNMYVLDVCEAVTMKTMKDYHDLYLKISDNKKNQFIYYILNVMQIW